MPEQPIAQALVDMVAQQSVEASRAVLRAINQPPVENLVMQARTHGLEAWLAACAPLHDPAWKSLADQRARFLAERMRTAAVLDDLKKVFASLECDWAVLKGPALEYTVYPRPDLRHSVDLDVLVRPDRFAAVVAALEADGFTLLDRNWPLLARLFPGQLRVRSPRGILIDLHWSVVNDPQVRRAFDLPTSTLLSHSRILDPQGIPALSAVHQLVHLGVHGSLSGANRLVWLLDAHLAAQDVEDWQEVVRAARQARASGGLALVLARAQRIWQTRVPEKALRSLAGGRLPLTVDRAIDRLGQSGRDPHRPAVSRAWARSMRTTPTDSFAEFGRHGLSWMRSGRLTDTTLTNARDPRSALFPVEDLDARRDYLGAVSATARV